MSASSKHNPSNQNTQTTHYHVIGGGTQFLVVRHSHAWHPPTDVMAEGDRLVVLVEIAGMKDGEFQVLFANQRLTITGTRQPRSEGYSAFHQMEVRYGEFRTDILLPWPVDEDEIVANYEDGFLRVELPRTMRQQIRVVEVQKNDSQ